MNRKLILGALSLVLCISSFGLFGCMPELCARQPMVFLDRSGKEVIDTHATWANSFSDGLAAVQN